MKAQIQYLKLFLFAITMFTIKACTSDWLEEKRDLKMIVPTTLKDMRSLLNNYQVLGMDNIGAMLISADDHYLPQKIYDGKSLMARDIYVWEKDLFRGTVNLIEWNGSFQQIFYVNNILEGLEKIERNAYNQEEWNDIKGGALFYRAKTNFNLVQMFAVPFRANINENSLGIPLKLSSDVNAKTERAGLIESYNQILEDLKESAYLLKAKPLRKTDASKPAAYALLARTYLIMNDYELALEYADSCLLNFSNLIDYNELNSEKNYPFVAMNNEVIFQSKVAPEYILFDDLKIDTSLYLSFHENDLRKDLFFRKDNSELYNFKGTYHGDFNMFSGIATDEILLIKAECLARLGDRGRAIAILNDLLTTRFEAGTFVPYEVGDAKKVLNIVLLERRKQLMFRGLRWSDLRRLNQVDETETILRRNIGNEIYELMPNENRYTFPIPNNIVKITEIEQNKR